MSSQASTKTQDTNLHLEYMLTKNNFNERAMEIVKNYRN